MAGEVDVRSAFLDLSDDLLAQISAGTHGFPLLALSRRGRDAVLERACNIQLKLMSTAWLSTVAPTARLLDRACRAAKPGLQLQIDGTHDHEYGDIQKHIRIESPLLSEVLQRGLGTGGWGNVHALSLVVREQGCLRHTAFHRFLLYNTCRGLLVRRRSM
jgi:hypothetical protein